MSLRGVRNRIEELERRHSTKSDKRRTDPVGAWSVLSDPARLEAILLLYIKLDLLQFPCPDHRPHAETSPIREIAACLNTQPDLAEALRPTCRHCG